MKSMLLKANKKRGMNKKGLSEIVAYTLLIVIALGLALLVYTWVKSIVPGEESECPSDVSLVIDSYSCNVVENKITVTLKNQGLFDVNGFFIRFAEKYDGAAIIKIDSQEKNGQTPIVRADNPKYGNGYGDKAIDVSKTETFSFIYGEGKTIEKIEVIPTIVDDENKLLSCKKSVVIERLKDCV